MKIDESLFAVLDKLSGEGWEEVEVYHKRGRSRTVRFAAHAAVTSFCQEEGWAVRAGDRRRSFFYAAGGEPRPDVAWPEADGRGVRLASAKPIPHWAPPSDLDVPLIGESETRGLFDALERELAGELPGARLVLGELADGSSESQLVSSREVEAAVRQRTATLYLEAVGPGRGAQSISLRLAERDARRFNPLTLGRRLADLLTIVEKGSAPARDRGEFLLAPAVGVRLLGALSDLWLGPGAQEKAARLTDRRGKLASPAFTLIDDGRLPGGVLEAPVDGEGQPTREQQLVEEGIFRQPLVAWWQSTSDPTRVSGCCRRPGWRDLPRPGPTHLYLRPDPATSVASLIENLSRGYYLLDTEGAPRVAVDDNRFAVPVCGFAIEGGRPTGSITGAWLAGSVSSFLNGIVTTARDLSFLPISGGMVGAPSLLIKGLELRQR
ncbi:MAG: hypothetical protein GY856_53330 [bacterium]|nr:hypothetical protein [bacterium]